MLATNVEHSTVNEDLFSSIKLHEGAGIDPSSDSLDVVVKIFCTHDLIQLYYH